MRRTSRYCWAASAIIAPLLLILFTIWQVKAFTPSVTEVPFEQREQTINNQAPPVVWTHWNAQQYALAEEAQWLWIGAAGGVIRWDKANQNYRRYTAVDGLPHKNVYAVAIDNQGNRWFGGDGGLSRLSSTERWSHFTPANSGLHSTLVDGIAVAADNTLWVSHVTLTVTARAEAVPGAYPLSLIGVTDNLTNTTALTVVVAATVTEQYLPILVR